MRFLSLNDLRGNGRDECKKEKLGRRVILSIGILNENVWEEFRDVRF